MYFRRQFTHVQWASLVILFLAIVSLSNQSQGSVSVEHSKHHSVNHLITNGTQAKSISYKHLAQHSDVCKAEDTQFQVTNTSTSPGLMKTFQHYLSGKKNFSHFNFHEGHILIIIQCLLSSLANVYTEKIFKDGDGMEQSIYVQNGKLYIFGVLFNSLSLVVHNVYRQKVFACGFFHGHNAYSIILIFVTALLGLSVAFILKFRTNMFHMLSAQVTTVIVITASIYFFEFKPSVDFFLAAPIVLLAIFIYNASRKKEKSYLEVGEIRMRRNAPGAAAAEEMDLIISPDDLHE